MNKYKCLNNNYLPKVIDEMVGDVSLRNGPFGIFNEIFNDNGFFTSFSENKFDVFLDKENNFVLEIDAPGYDRGEISLTIDGDSINVNMEKKEEEDDKGKKYFQRKYINSSKSFSYSIPKNIKIPNIEDINAKLDNGVLRISFPSEKSIDYNRNRIEIQ